jgi:hypothetical protein
VLLSQALAAAILNEHSEAALAGGGLRRLNGLYLGFATPEEAAAEQDERAARDEEAAREAASVAASGGLPPEGLPPEGLPKEKKDARGGSGGSGAGGSREAAGAVAADAEVAAWRAPVLATLKSENPNEGLSTYEVVPILN